MLTFINVNLWKYNPSRELHENCESYCAEAARTPLYAANLREDAKLLKYFQA